MKKYRLHRLKKQITQIVLIVTSFALLVTLIGCDAFVRKFTRKPKKDDFNREEMVLAPEEFKGPKMTKEEQYRQYYLFWESWHTELIESLLQHRSQKKLIDCNQEAIENLDNLRALLNKEQQKKLDIYILQLKNLLEQIRQDIYGRNTSTILERAEDLKRRIQKDFSYPKIKNYLI